jgi:hypothetical protein
MHPPLHRPHPNCKEVSVNAATVEEQGFWLLQGQSKSNPVT